MKIGIIGAGPAGLAAAWALAPRHRVTVYERAPRLGGPPRTIDVGGGRISADICAFQRTAQPWLDRLLTHLGVPTVPSDGSVALSLIRHGSRLEYSTRPASLLAQPARLVEPRFLGMLRDIARFRRAARRLLDSPPEPVLPLAAMLTAGGYGRGLVEDHLLPLAMAAWPQPPAALLAAPAIGVLRSLDALGLLDRPHGSAWRAVSGGRSAFLARLAEAAGERILTATAATRVRRRAERVDIADAAGGIRRFDHVVLACRADEAMALLDDPTETEAAVLGAFAYETDRLVMHGDITLMPVRRVVWSARNVLAVPDGRVAVTTWLNRVQRLDAGMPLLLTVNPAKEPRADRVYGRFADERPARSPLTAAAQSSLDRLQGQQRTWHAGAHLGQGLDDDSLASGLAVAVALGARLPWPVRLRPAGGRRLRASAP